MNSILKDKLLRPMWLRRLVRLIFATGDTVRRVVQKPIIESFLPNDGNLVIDVGAGRGMYTFDSLIPRYRQVVAVDIRTDHIEYLAAYKERFGLSRLWLVQASAEYLPFKDGVFDTVVCTEVIEHLSDDHAGIAELSRMLQPESCLILSVPVPPAPRFDGAHVREGYTYHQLKALLNTYQLSVIDKDYCLLLISRSVLHMIAFFEGRLKLPPPILFLCYLERWLLRYGKADLRPYDIIVKSKKEAAPHAEPVITIGS